ncbi:hypothetical protein BLNAU_22667 [Blattamonas nauphoetae]|uniref:Uncharacterized protein n=1 Tax=Blattamonas nauphoetae TaxID=2049346 RepID=A0ABQ9WSG0_9EUKA|nr:hypothetical protein BLNAU_22667 [Blattamonas nauphoetae]
MTSPPSTPVSSYSLRFASPAIEQPGRHMSNRPSARGKITHPHNVKILRPSDEQLLPMTPKSPFRSPYSSSAPDPEMLFQTPTKERSGFLPSISHPPESKREKEDFSILIPIAASPITLSTPPPILKERNEDDRIVVALFIFAVILSFWLGHRSGQTC